MTAMSMPPLILPFAAPVILFLTFWAICYWPLAGLIRGLETGAKRGSAWVMRTRVGKWAIEHPGPIGSYAPVVLVLVLGGIAATGAGYLFVELSEAARLDTTVVYRLDWAINAWFGNERQPGMTVLLGTATNIGGVLGMAVLVAVVAAILLARKERASAVFLVVTAGVGALLNLGLKMIFARARPDLASAIAEARWYSFPSGHAMGPDHLRSARLPRAATALAVGSQVGGPRGRHDDGGAGGPVSRLFGSPLGFGHRRRMERGHGMDGLRGGGVRTAGAPSWGEGGSSMMWAQGSPRRGLAGDSRSHPIRAVAKAAARAGVVMVTASTPAASRLLWAEGLDPCQVSPPAPRRASPPGE